MKRAGLFLTLTCGLLANSAIADEAAEGAIKARQSVMQLYAFNLGALGAMAKTAVPYDAEVANAHAGNLLALSCSGYLNLGSRHLCFNCFSCWPQSALRRRAGQGAICSLDE